MIDREVAILISVLTATIFMSAGVIYIRRYHLNVEEYIVARNSADTPLATATLVASVVGAWILFSPAETGTWAGLVALIGYGIGQAAPLLAFIVIGSRMRRLMPEGHSLTEYVRYRYGRNMHLFTLAVVIFYMFVFLSAELTGISEAFHLLANTPLGLTALIIGLLTATYTAYGGIRASIFTDSIQFTMILPLLLISFVVTIVALGGFERVFDPINDNSPQLLSLTHGPGIEFGVTLIIAILAANMFHQGFWQRVYTCRDEKTLRRGFSIAAAVVIPIIILAGILGVIAAGQDVVGDNPSVALFSLVQTAMPTWAALIILVLAIVLVMSSIDTLLNGIASAITSDLAQFMPNIRKTSLLNSSRMVTVALIFPAIFIASRGYSVLYLFLIADLVCAAALFPVFWGLYSKRFGGNSALASCVIGLVVGALFFPTSDFTPWLDIPMAGRFVVSFGTALGASTLVSLLLTTLAGQVKIAQEYDYSRLRERVRLIQE